MLSIVVVEPLADVMTRLLLMDFRVDRMSCVLFCSLALLEIVREYLCCTYFLVAVVLCFRV